jgi:hypothetical protein
MNRTRFHDILHGNSDTTPMIRTNQTPMLFPLKKIRKADTAFNLAEGTFGLAEGKGIIGFEDKVDILYDFSCNYFYLSNWEKEESLEQENIHLSEIYVGDYQEKDIYYTNPLLEEK